MNKVIMSGRLTRNVETKMIGEGTTLCENCIAVDGYRNKTKVTDFFEVRFFGKLAERVNSFCKKGTLILIEGEFQTKEYQAKDGTKKTSYFIVCSSFEKLSFDKEEPKAEEPKPEPVIPEVILPDDGTDGLPF